MALAIEQPEWISIGVNRLPRGMPARRPAPLMSESDLELLGVLALQPLRRPSSPGPGASCRRIAVLGHPRRFRATRLATSSATEDIRLRQAEFGDRGTHMCNRGRSGLFSSRFNFSIDGCAFGKKFAEFLIFGHGYFAKRWTAQFYRRFIFDSRFPDFRIESNRMHSNRESLNSSQVSSAQIQHRVCGLSRWPHEPGGQAYPLI